MYELYYTCKKELKEKRKWKTFKRRGLANQRTSGKTLTGTSTLMQITETGKGRTAMNNEKIMIEAVIKALARKLKEKEQAVKIGIEWGSCGYR